ncbi:hypothetical protein F5880DRAFT_1644613, partial [Lentinula raphanica]
VLSCGVPHSHVYSTLVDSEFARFFYYDRSVHISVLDLKERNDQIIFAKMIRQLRARPPKGFGVIDQIEADLMTNPQSLKAASTLPTVAQTHRPASSDIFPLGKGTTFTFPYKDEQKHTAYRTVKLLSVLFRAHTIIGRGTIVIKVECACDFCGGQCDWAGKKLILKISFPPEDRVAEHTFLDRCREKAVGEHAWVLQHLPKIYHSFEMPFGIDTPQHNLKKRFQGDYEMRILRGSIQEELQPLSELRTAQEFAQVYFDVVQCHHWVYTYPKILHRDISDGNIMFREEEGKIYGVLNDW